ncbi:hypothetical protein E4Q46_20045 [Salmonella enterica]|uniref:Uncharacterized protein n=1 Tax=Salmonella enterica TaxID=28901 RepID=A0A5Y4A0A2_SALER|nr:hypothetical protein [Salmonella enterica]EBL5306972.1 hypothetical protein [Salmonella enterica subsp. enterica serovar Newport]ECD3734798.1 hypothetical protein [Salmonella enterica subsp. enterica serovar Stanley]ECZ5203019.1 hypothetical protein [Salmonella enterica subsp. enterica serovar Kentucky]EDV9370733.1 hypothetical protein [Salmonella enterica subsp. enterica serovar Bovismorbificans]
MGTDPCPGLRTLSFSGYTIALKLVYIVRNKFFPARILAGFYLIIYGYTDMKYLILASALLLTACAGPGGSYWGVTPANSDVCPSGKCQ